MVVIVRNVTDDNIGDSDDDNDDDFNNVEHEGDVDGGETQCNIL